MAEQWTKECLCVRVGADPDLHLHRPLVRHLPPLQFKSTASRAKKAIVIIWFTSLVLVLPDAIVMDTRRSSALRVETHYFTDCTYTWGNQYTKIYQLLIVFFLYFAPFLFMSFFYYQIVKVLWNKNIPGSTEVNSRQIRTGQ
ncbi:hypothetical protein CEXT_483681 [Caerostris extrusa]|uniref:G-protein coupled receptors family 1 profile domain-containing protein n=1 Tax=Caerostris extrusa TaxID=172846 RepID=A0AAV4QKN5_CAEEX|nr:hypothetical protein CEXT_483681 [Caerostris extrusa]